VGAGSSVITASQTGNGTYKAAPNVTRPLIVSKANQSITFPALLSYTNGAPPIVISSMASSGQPVTITSSVPTVATVTNNTVTIVGVGRTSLIASAPATQNYNKSPSISRVLVVKKPPVTQVLKTQ